MATDDTTQSVEKTDAGRFPVPARPAILIRAIISRNNSLIFLILFWIGLGLASPDFLAPSNLVNVALQTSVLAIVAMGMTFTMLTAGIDLSVGSAIALTSAISAGLAAQANVLPSGAYAGQALPATVAILLTIVAGGILGAINGLLIVRGGMPPFVATLAMLAAARGLTLVYTGGYVIPATDRVLTYLGTGNIGPIPVPVIVMILLFAILWYILTQTRFGLYVYAVGGNEEASRLAGVRTKLVIAGAYVISGLTAAVGGVILMGRLNSAQPNLATGFELDAIAAPVIGGTSLFGGVGTLQGALIGAFIMGTLSNGMNLVGADPYLQQVIKGGVFILAVAWNFYTRRKR
ncbi:MAG TPA: ABC transporter permease [Anaerolineales bacterium]|nr:ABC transporter permease [Anaerolineales bacterium]